MELVVDCRSGRRCDRAWGLMETHTFKGADGQSLNAVDYGGAGKPPLLLVHGGSAHARWWDFVGPGLVDSCHVLALDQRGHGDSPWTDEWAYGSRHYVADLAVGNRRNGIVGARQAGAGGPFDGWP